MNNSKRLGIIGCGNMGEAIARGIISSNLFYGGDLYFFDTDRDKAEYLKKSLNANAEKSSKELVEKCGSILIAVKPKDIDGLLREITASVDESKLVLSIAAGITIKKIKIFLRREARVIRLMPNVAARAAQAITALCCDNYATAGDRDVAKKIFTSMGEVIEVEEANMDAVTAISGSGPAYFFYLTEILENTAVELGIDRKKAKRLAVKTALGSAALLEEGKIGAEKLRMQVTSKGGTTEAAFRVFAERELGETLKKGITAAYNRAKELSEGS